jgi:hypothetical protein
MPRRRKNYNKKMREIAIAVILADGLLSRLGCVLRQRRSTHGLRSFWLFPF